MLWPGTVYGPRLGHLKPALPPALMPSSGDCLGVSEGWIPPCYPQLPGTTTLTSLLEGSTQHGDSQAAALGPLLTQPAEQGCTSNCVCHRQPLGYIQHLKSARKSAPEGYFGSLVMQFNCTQVVQGLNRPLHLETAKLITNPQTTGSKRIAGCLWGPDVMTLPITAELNLSEATQRGKICHFPRWNFAEVESITLAGNDILNCFNSVSMFKLISLFHLNGNSHLITLAAKLQIIFESNTA